MGRNVATWRAMVMTAVVAAAGVAWGDGAEAGHEAAAKAAWGRISNEIKNADDLQTIVGMHDRFLNEYADTSLAQTVAGSEDVYKALLKSDAKKFRGKWVAAGQIEVMEKTWRDEAGAALSLYEAGKWKEAVDAAKKVEGTDRENGLALAIEGDAAYHQKATGAARSAFERLVALDQGNVLAENNLAVLAFENKQMVSGMVHYTKALGHGSANVAVVDNVAEAMHTYLTAGGANGSAGDKNNAAYKELSAKAAGPEGEMIAMMEKKGLVRRGAVWVTQSQQEKITQDVSAIKYQMAMLDKQYSDLQQKIAAAQQGLARANTAYQRALNNLAAIDASMRTVNGNYANSDMTTRDRVQYALTQATQQQSDCEKTLSDLTQQMPEFQKAAERLKGLLASADQKYTGMQRIMEPDDGVGAAKSEDVLAQAARPTGVSGSSNTVAGPGVTAGGQISLPEEAAIAVKPVAALQTEIAPGVSMNVATVTSDDGVVLMQAPLDTGGMVYTPRIPLYTGPGNYGPGLESGPQVGLENGKLVVKTPPPGYGQQVVYGPLVEKYYKVVPTPFVANYHPPMNEQLPVYQVPLVPEWVRLKPVPIRQTTRRTPELVPLNYKDGQWSYWRPEGPMAPALAMQANFKNDPYLQMPTSTMQPLGLGLVPYSNPSTPVTRVPSPYPGYGLVWVPITSVQGQAGMPWGVPPPAPNGGLPMGGGGRK